MIACQRLTRDELLVDEGPVLPVGARVARQQIGEVLPGSIILTNGAHRVGHAFHFKLRQHLRVVHAEPLLGCDGRGNVRGSGRALVFCANGGVQTFQRKLRGRVVGCGILYRVNFKLCVPDTPRLRVGPQLLYR